MYHNRTKRIFCVLLTLALLLGNVVMAASAAPAYREVTATTVNAEESVELVLKTADDLSGAVYANVSFYCADSEDAGNLDVWFESEYYDEESYEYVPYPDGELHGFLDLNKYVVPGVYTVANIEVYDWADNRTVFIRDYDPDIYGGGYNDLPQALKSVSLTVKNPNPLDQAPPQLTGISLSSTTVTTAAPVEIVVTGTDDLAGLSYGSVEFWCPETDSWIHCYLEDSYWDSEKGEYVSCPAGELRGTVSAYDTTAAGVFIINTVYLCDYADNYVSYYTDVNDPSDTRQELPESLKDLAVTVSNDAVVDDSVPQLTDLKLSSATLTGDGTIEIIANATDAGGNLDYAYVYFINEELGEEISCRLRSTYYDSEAYEYVTYPNGELHGTVYASSYEYKPSGEFKLDRMRLYDQENNCHYYYVGGYQDWYDSSMYSDFPEALKSLKITYINNGAVDTTPPQVIGLFFLAASDTQQTDSVSRLAGSTRYDTAFKSADQLKSVLGISKFKNIIVASGTGFADALAGSYLAAVKDAPILLVRDNKATVNQVKDYIRKNLATGGTVYLLGGKAAVPASMETGLEGFNIKRLGGNTRYDTNLLILKEAGVAGKDILVCTGKNFADSLSASAAGLPILLVKDSLNTAQKDFLKGTTGKKYIIGGTSAVSTAVEKQLASYGTVKRIAGSTRYQTSVLVAGEFFSKPTQAVLAYAQNFPDGLCGGPLAYALKAPLILTNSGKEATAAEYTTGLGIRSGYVLGGSTLISDKAVKRIFSDTSITVK